MECRTQSVGEGGSSARVGEEHWIMGVYDQRIRVVNNSCTFKPPNRKKNVQKIGNCYCELSREGWIIVRTASAKVPSMLHNHTKTSKAIIYFRILKI